MNVVYEAKTWDGARMLVPDTLVRRLVREALRDAGSGDSAVSLVAQAFASYMFPRGWQELVEIRYDAYQQKRVTVMYGVR